MYDVFDGARRGTRTPTVSRQNLNLVRLPVPPVAHNKFLNGDPTGTRTRDTTVKGWCLNRLTMGPHIWCGSEKKNRRRPTFPGGCPPSIISAKELDFCVRDGNRCDLFAIITGFFILCRAVRMFLLLLF